MSDPDYRTPGDLIGEAWEQRELAMQAFARFDYVAGALHTASSACLLTLAGMRQRARLHPPPPSDQ
jgi:hypothetical protein